MRKKMLDVLILRVVIHSQVWMTAIDCGQ